MLLGSNCTTIFVTEHGRRGNRWSIITIRMGK